MLFVRKALTCLTALAVIALATQNASAQVLEWAVEGPISAVDPATGTITAMGLTVQIPADLVIDGTNGITGANLAALLDDAAPSRIRSLFESPATSPFPYSGGTLKAAGEIVVVDGVNVYVTTAAVVELAENVIFGLLESVDVASNSFVVSGVSVTMNPDERFPADILDAGGEPLALADLATGIGSQVGVVGYFVNGTMYAQTVESEVIPVTPGMDTVRIDRAQGRNRGNNNNELRVDGIVAPFDPNATITISNAATGAVIGVTNVAAGVVAGQGDFTFRVRNLNLMPTRVRATSSNGGVHEIDVDIRN